ncbi:MAG: hypothetical protein GAK28_00367 [Luteibacter sp.]|uniref:phage tail protein n=1 Tax=Luteibacter sp. TaxID=1886636 RepID=UPI001381A4A6|nr:tail fiber protein [Luteibacter sp.]KAF1009723.1 MAG: hypothetical protein GAK28_00367 [Luteibacter sp.]
MSEPFVGQIMMAGFNFAPRGYALCNGQTMSIQQNQALFALLGTQFGGNGTTNFVLPDLRGRAPLGMGQLTGGTNYPLAGFGGAENVTIGMAETPTHTHTLRATTQQPAVKNPTGGYLTKNPTENLYAAPGGATAVLAPGSIGLSPPGGQPHTNMQPFRTINFAIALTGIFPPRP